MTHIIQKRDLIKKPHPWKRVQTNWAFDAWAKRNPDERKRVEKRHKLQTGNLQILATQLSTKN